MPAYLTPGPSQPYPRLREYMDDAWAKDVPAISHRGRAFTDVYRRTDAALRAVMGVPDDYTVMFVGSATEAMERAVQGVVADRSHHLISGAFSQKWYRIAEQLGKHPTATRAQPGQGFDLNGAPAPDDTELLCITHNETSTGLAVPAAALAHFTSLPGRPLVALDVVSSAPIVTVPWGGTDLVFFSVQKAFGLPAGLGVLCAGPRALARAGELRQAGMSLGSFHSLPELAGAAANYQTPATPNVLGIYLLGRVAEDMLERGLGQLREENRQRAQRLYEAFGAGRQLRPFVADPLWQSPTVVVADVRGGNTALCDSLARQGLVVGRGYGDFRDQHVRIANFPATSEAEFDRLVAHLLQSDSVRV